MEKPNNDINTYYSKRASEYEQIYYREIPERQQEIAEIEEYLIELVNGKSVVELACGTGYWTERMSRTARCVLSSDYSLEMIAEAQKKDYVCPTQFVQADMYGMPVQRHSFDIAVFGFWFSHEPVQRYEKFFRLLKSFVKTTGQIWLLDNNSPAEGDQFKSTGTDEHGNNYKQRFLNNGEEYSVLKNYFEENQLKEIFEAEFDIEDLIYKKYYWHILLRPKQ